MNGARVFIYIRMCVHVDSTNREMTPLLFTHTCM